MRNAEYCRRPNAATRFGTEPLAISIFEPKMSGVKKGEPPRSERGGGVDRVRIAIFTPDKRMDFLTICLSGL